MKNKTSIEIELKKLNSNFNTFNKINKQLEIKNKIASADLIIKFKNSGFKSETKKEIETQAPIIINALNTIHENIEVKYDS